MYQVGELILYGSTGVCKVADITTRDMSGMDQVQLYYVLKPLYQNYMISTPVDPAKVFMRRIITKDEAEQLIDRIPSIQVSAYYNSAFWQLAEHYKTFFQTHNCMDLVKLIMSLYVKKQVAEQEKRKFGTVDERFMKRAEELLYGELAAALEIPKEQVSEYIADRVNEEQGEKNNERNT